MKTWCFGIAIAAAALTYGAAVWADAPGDLADGPVIPAPLPKSAYPNCISGVVLGPDGKPSAGATVYSGSIVSGYEVTRVKTDAAGQFVFPGSVYGMRVPLYACNGDDATVQVFRGRQGRIATLTMEKNALAQIHGRVVDTANKPVPFTCVNLLLHGVAARTDVTLTDSHGDYAFYTVIPGAGYELQALKTGYTGIISSTLDAKPGEKISEPSLTIKQATSFVGGRVVDRHGKPAAGVTIFTVQVQGVETKTDRDGRFRLSPVPKGLVFLEARDPGFGEGQFMDGTTNGVITMK